MFFLGISPTNILKNDSGGFQAEWSMILDAHDEYLRRGANFERIFPDVNFQALDV